MRRRLATAFRVGRWAVLLPWMCVMDDGCAAIDALHEGRAAAAVQARLGPPNPAWVSEDRAS